MTEMRIAPHAHGFTVRIGRLAVGIRQINDVLWIEFEGDNYKFPFATIRMDAEGVELWHNTDPNTAAEARVLYTRREDPHRLA